MLSINLLPAAMLVPIIERAARQRAVVGKKARNRSEKRRVAAANRGPRPKREPRQCSVVDCGGAYVARGLCSKHYNARPEARAARRKIHERYRLANPDFIEAMHLRVRYGMTPSDYERMLAAQGGACAICRSTDSGHSASKKRRFLVDHDHDTGAPRGLLCHRCNVGLGMFRDTPEHLDSAIKYLAHHGRVRRAAS